MDLLLCRERMFEEGGTGGRMKSDQDSVDEIEGDQLIRMLWIDKLIRMQIWMLSEQSDQDAEGEMEDHQVNRANE